MPSYEPPTVAYGTPFRFGHETQLAPGVRGFAVEQSGEVWIPVIVAEVEGSGAVGRFLDSLSPRCVIPCVFNPRLMGMLARRGWVPTFADDGEEWRRR